MAVNASDGMLNVMSATRLDLEELKLNIDNMFLVINGVIVSREYTTAHSCTPFGYRTAV